MNFDTSPKTSEYMLMLQLQSLLCNGGKKTLAEKGEEFEIRHCTTTLSFWNI
jgi:hypothetical protein